MNPHIRRFTREVKIGSIGIGGTNPIRIQSMTTTVTRDVKATVSQAIRLAEAGCEIIRITAPNKEAARALQDIHSQFRKAGFTQPLVADIHFLPAAAMEAIEHVEKVRINPGNFGQRKQQPWEDAFGKLVQRAQVLGKALRIGVNHGSLSEEILHTYGNTPLGMVESALTFIRVAESYEFHDLCLSMKSSNPKIMIAAYRLAVERMEKEEMHYPLHLGLTEAGAGEDGRIKSAIGIGTLLYEGLGDTIRVSLTEDPVHEIIVCQKLIQQAEKRWNSPLPTTKPLPAINLQEKPLVILPASLSLSEYSTIIECVLTAHAHLGRRKIEGLLLSIEKKEDLTFLATLQKALSNEIRFFVLEISSEIDPESFLAYGKHFSTAGHILCRKFKPNEGSIFEAWARFCTANNLSLAVDAPSSTLPFLPLQNAKNGSFFFTLSQPQEGLHALESYRTLARFLLKQEDSPRIWIRNTGKNRFLDETTFEATLLENAILSGALLCEGIGTLLSIETVPSLEKATNLAYDLLQGARIRNTKTEFITCPGCGRTLYDLQATTKIIKERLGHLQEVTIAIMGCIVNGPGEMADADFGYVGGAPGKINLYKNKKCVKYNIPEKEAIDHLVELIRVSNNE